MSFWDVLGFENTEEQEDLFSHLDIPNEPVYLLQEIIELSIQDQQFSDLDEIVTDLKPDLPYINANAQEVLIHAHTYVQTDNLEEALAQTKYSPKLNQAKALIEFSKHDYIQTITHLSSIPTNQLDESVRIIYAIALQQEVGLTQQDKDELLGPLLKTSTFANRLYSGEELTLNLSNPNKTIQNLFGK